MPPNAYHELINAVDRARESAHKKLTRHLLFFENHLKPIFSEYKEAGLSDKVSALKIEHKIKKEMKAIYNEALEDINLITDEATNQINKDHPKNIETMSAKQQWHVTLFWLMVATLLAFVAYSIG